MNDDSRLFFSHFPDARGAVYHAFTPYRFCPIGAHVDHQYGFVTGFAIDKGVTLLYQRTDDASVRLFSEDFPTEVAFSLHDDQIRKQGDWGDYLRGAVYALGKKHRLLRGIRGVIKGSMPIGGLSSSAAVILCYLQALMQANDHILNPRETIDTAYIAEHNFVGVSVGLLDQSCEMYCRKNHLLYLDTKERNSELIPANPDMPDFDIVIFYSGLSRRLGSGFNNRVDELRAASWYLKSLENLPLNPFSETRLRDVPEEVYHKHEHSLPEPFRRRARHFYEECARVHRGAQAWRKGDLVEFGKQVFLSGESSINNYETGSPHLIALHEALLEAPGVYGGRFCGAGFKGCAGAIVDPTKTEDCIEFVTKRYLDKYPNLLGAYSAHVCRTADGVSALLK